MRALPRIWPLLSRSPVTSIPPAPVTVRLVSPDSDSRVRFPSVIVPPKTGKGALPSGIRTSSPLVGTTPPSQLAATFQSALTEPFQVRSVAPTTQLTVAPPVVRTNGAPAVGVA